MSKANRPGEDDLRPEYDFGSMKGGVRGKVCRSATQGKELGFARPRGCCRLPLGRGGERGAPRRSQNSSVGLTRGPYKADIIVAVITPGALAAKKATSIIPIVSPATGDPVASGIVASLARPGGNVTGLSLMGPGLSGKRLALLKEAVAGISRAAVLASFADPIAAPQVNDMENAARALGIHLRAYDAGTPEALPGALPPRPGTAPREYS